MIESCFHPEFCLGDGAVGADAIFYGDNAVFILTQRRINRPLLRHDLTVNDGEIFFFKRAAFQNFSQFARDQRIFCHDDHAAGFTVETVDQVGMRNSWALRVEI